MPADLSEDELGVAVGEGPYPAKKRRSRSNAATRAKYARYTASEKGRARHARAAAKGQRWSGVGASIAREEWVAIWRQQGRRCWICHHPLRNRYDSKVQPDTRVCGLDHDHQLESQLKKDGVAPDLALRRSIRGLLCNYPCNRLLVRYWTGDRLARASEYVRDFPAQRILNA